MRKYDLPLNEIDKDSMFTRVFSLTWQLDKYFCDKLYNADEATAKAMVASRTDRAQ